MAYHRVQHTGFPLLVDQDARFASVAIGIFSRQGSRDEHLPGVTHLLEHMLFKRTRRRNNFELVSALEDRGGYVDAMTTQDSLGLYARVLPEDLPLALDLLGDMASQPVFTADDLERERQVVLEELASVQETPDDLVFRLLFEALFPGHPMGREILGTEESLHRITTADLYRRWREVFARSQVILVAAGPVDPEQLVPLAERSLALPAATARLDTTPLPPPLPWRLHREPRLQQLQIALGLRVPPYRDPLRAPLHLLNTLLGGGMSSRLFWELREKRGLVYTVSSFLEHFRDVGVLGIHLTVSPEAAPRALAVVRRIFEDLASGEISQEELDRVKHRVRGSTLISEDSLSQRLLRLANHELLLGRILPLNRLLEEVEAVSLEDLRAVAARFLVPERWSAGLVGPEVSETLLEPWFTGGKEPWKPMASRKS